VPANVAHALSDNSKVKQRHQGWCMPPAAFSANHLVAFAQKQARTQGRLGRLAAESTGVTVGRLALNGQVYHAVLFQEVEAAPFASLVHHRLQTNKNSPAWFQVPPQRWNFPFKLSFSANSSASTTWGSPKRLAKPAKYASLRQPFR
jgi:hypothetical protein